MGAEEHLIDYSGVRKTLSVVREMLLLGHNFDLLWEHSVNAHFFHAFLQPRFHRTILSTQ